MEGRRGCREDLLDASGEYLGREEIRTDRWKGLQHRSAYDGSEDPVYETVQRTAFFDGDGHWLGDVSEYDQGTESTADDSIYVYFEFVVERD